MAQVIEILGDKYEQVPSEIKPFTGEKCKYCSLRDFPENVCTDADKQLGEFQCFDWRKGFEFGHLYRQL